MNRYFRLLLLGIAGLQLLLALGFVFQFPFVLNLWPLPYTDPLTFIFIGSILAAAAASTLWCLYAREDGALAGVALDYVTICVPAAILGMQSRDGSPLRGFGIIMAVGALFGIVISAWSIRIPIRDVRPMPRVVRWAFVIFVVGLILVGGSLVLKNPNVLPWSVMADARVLYGWMFIGAATYFAFGLLRPSWHNAAGQLVGFLAYDLVLILPFVLLFPRVQPDRMLSLSVYTLVVVGSGVLAVYYLFLNPTTRILRTTLRRVEISVAGSIKE